MVGVIMEMVLLIKIWQLTVLYPLWKEACGEGYGDWEMEGEEIEGAFLRP